MSDSAMVISSDFIDFNKLQNFVISIGGKLVSQDSETLVITCNKASVWLNIQSEEFAEQFYDDNCILEWEAALGAKPKSIIELELGHDEMCHQIYLFVAFMMGQMWNVVLDDVDDNVMGYLDLIKKWDKLKGGGIQDRHFETLIKTNEKKAKSKGLD